MRVRVLGCVALLLAGLATAAPGAQVDVPHGRLGDVATYAFVETHEDRACDGATTNARSQGRVTLSIDGPLIAHDEEGAPRAAALASWSARPTFLWCSQEFFVGRNLWVGLDDRTPVRADTRFVYNSGAAIDADIVASTFAPSIRLAGAEAWIDFGEFRYQGRALAPGADLSREICPWHAQNAKAGPVWTPHSGREAARETIAFDCASVAGPATHEGAPAIEVVTRIRHDERALLPGGASTPIRWSVEQRTLLAPSAPYPVEVHVVEERAGFGAPATWGDERQDWTRETRFVLERVAPGAGDLPWDARVPPGDDAPLDRAPGPRPRDGTGSRLPVSLDEAVRAAESEPSLARFAAWRLVNPSSRPIGATLYHQDERTPHAWTLMYGAPGADTFFLVRVTALGERLVATEDAEMTTGWPTGRLPPHLVFEEEDAPPTFLTLAAMERRWAATAPADALAEGPDTFWWGYLLFATDAALTLQPTGLPFAYTTHLPPHDILRTARMGHYAWTWGDGASFARQHEVALDAETGDLRLALYGGFDVAPVPARSAAPTPYREEGARGSTSWLPAAVTGGLALAVAIAYFFHVLKFAITHAAVSLYTRLNAVALLDHPLRASLARLITEQPGISPPALQAATGAGWTTVVYHLHVLQRHGYVAGVVHGRHKRFFATGTVAPADRAELVVLANARTRQAFDLVRERARVDRGAVAAHLGVTPAAAYWHLRRLEDAGLVRRVKSGRVVEYEAFQPPSAQTPPST